MLIMYQIRRSPLCNKDGREGERGRKKLGGQREREEKIRYEEEEGGRVGYRQELNNVCTYSL